MIKCNKLKDPVVINLLNSSDCIGLLETRAVKSVDISLPGYNGFRKDRAKHKNACKPSGGIAVIVKVRKMAKIRNQYSQVPHLTMDTTWESDKSTIRHHKQEPRGQPFPSR